MPNVTSRVTIQDTVPSNVNKVPEHQDAIAILVREYLAPQKIQLVGESGGVLESDITPATAAKVGQ
jgi:hypothetical protein